MALHVLNVDSTTELPHPISKNIYSFICSMEDYTQRLVHARKIDE